VRTDGRPRLDPAGLRAQALPGAARLVVQLRADLDRSALRARDLRGPLNRLVEILALEEVEAAELLLGLREGTVGDQALAVAHPDGRRRRRGLQAGAGHEDPGRLDLLSELAVGLHDPRSVLRGHRRQARLVLDDAEQVAHETSWLRGAAPGRPRSP